MKIFSFIIILFIGYIATSAKAENLNIKISIEGLQDTSLIIGHYFEKKILVDDTIQINHLGQGELIKDEKLPEGIYVIYLPNKTYFDVLIGSDQSFSITTKDHDFIDYLNIKNAQESSHFLSHQRYLSEAQKKATKLQEQLKAVKNNEDSTQLLSAKLNEINNNVMSYWNKAIDDNQNTFFASFLKALKEVDIPEFEAEENAVNKDSVIQMKKYHYFSDHYFDNIDLTDDRLLRTPFFTNKIDTYLSKMIAQNPDTIAAASIMLIEKSRQNEEMFKFMIQYLFNRAVESKLMGMDAIIVALGEKYYLAGETPWANDKFLKDLEDRIKLLKPTLIGKVAHDLKMESVTGEYFKLSEVIAPYTILAFWEPSCGHCKKEIPKLHEEVLEKYKDKGIKIFAVYTQADKKEWSTFIEEHNLFDFINVYDPYQTSGFRNYYDISTTPVIYILDKDKKIVAKRIGVENIPGFFEFEIKNGRL